MKRFARGLIVALLTLVVALLGAAGLLLGTDAGMAWTLRQAQALAPEVFGVAEVRGHLFGRLELRDVNLRLPMADLSAGLLVLDWSPRALFRRELLVNQISLQRVRYEGKPVAEEPPPEPLQFPIELPEFKPPLRLDLRQLELVDVAVVASPGAAPLVIDRAELVAHWDDDGLALERLSSRGPDHAVDVSGSLDPMRAYALTLQDRIALELADQRSLVIEGTIQGDRERLTLTQQLSGAAAASVSGSLEQPLVAPRWQLLLELVKLPGALAAADLDVDLGGRLEAAGDLDSASLDGSLATASPAIDLDGLSASIALAADIAGQRLTIRQLRVTQRGMPLRLSVTGVVSADQELDLKGDWEAVQWPLVSAPAVRSSKGRMAVTGAVSDYRVALDAELDGSSFPASVWTASGRGDASHLQLEQLLGRLLEGELSVRGEVQWSPQLSWNLQAGSRHLNPGVMAPDYRADIDLDLLTDGTLADEQLRGRVVLQRLAGSLRDQPLAGRGEVHFGGGAVEMRRLEISAADARLAADGRVGPQSDLRWSLAVPQLGQLLAGASGEISGEGRISGPQSLPRVTGRLRARDISQGSVGLARLDADIDVDTADGRRSEVMVRGTDLKLAEQVVEQLELTVDGFIARHRLALTATHPQARLAVGLAGGYDGARWAGELRSLDIDSAPLGDWRLQRPVRLTLGPERAEASLLCLLRADTHLCAEGQWQAAGAASGRFDLARLPLAWFKPLLPDGIREVTGQLSARGELSRGRTLQAELIARVTPGRIRVAGAGADEQLSHAGADLEFSAAGEGGSGTLRAGVGPGRVLAELDLPDLLRVADVKQARLQGDLRVDVPELGFLPLLVPQLATIEGQLKGSFDVAGSLGKPDVRGAGRLSLARLDVPEVGFQLSDSHADVKVGGGQLKLSGRLVSGGSIDLRGGMELDAAKGWPLTLSVVGDRFVAVDLPTMQVLVSPDLKIDRDAEGLALTGQVVVPAAEVIVRDLPAGTRSASPDVVVVRPGAEPVVEEAIPINTAIRLVLGDKVHIAALGLDGFVRGEVTLRARPGKPLRATGDVRIDEGTFRAYSQDLEIERALFSFASSPIDNPGLNVRATRAIDDVVVGVNALGTARKVTITTFSTPGMSENDRISYLVTGKPASEGAKLSLNRQLAKNLSVGVSLDTHTGERAFVTRYRLLRTLYSEVSSSARSSTLDLFYTVEIE